MDIVEQLKRDEGLVLHVYVDSLGIPSAGYGHNLQSHGIDLPLGTSITQEQADDWLAQDIADAQAALDSHIPWASGLDDARYGALLNLTFNLGIGVAGGHHGLLSFTHVLGFIESGDYPSAAAGMLNSLWARQVGARARRLAQQILTGEWQ